MKLYSIARNDMFRDNNCEEVTAELWENICKQKTQQLFMACLSALDIWYLKNHSIFTMSAIICLVYQLSLFL